MASRFVNAALVQHGEHTNFRRIARPQFQLATHLAKGAVCVAC